MNLSQRITYQTKDRKGGVTHSYFLPWRSTEHSCQTAGCLLDWKSCTSRKRKGRWKCLLLSWLAWLPKSHMWEDISHICNTQMWCFPEWTFSRDVPITFPSKVSTWVFQQNAKSAFPVQLVTPLDLLGSKCNGNTPALWLENSFSKSLTWVRNSHSFCLVLQGLLLQRLTWQSITSKLVLMDDVLGEKLARKIWIPQGYFSSHIIQWTPLHHKILYILFLRMFPKDLAFWSRKQALQDTSVWGAIYITVVLHTYPR